MYVLCSRFLLFSVDCPLSVPMPPPPPRKYHTYCHSERDINKHPAQRRTIISWHYHFAVRTKYSRASSSCPHYILQLHSPLRERCGRRQPPAERSPVLPLEQTEYHQAAGIRPSTRYQVPVVRVCTGLFAFVVDFVLHLGPLRVFPFANYTRTTVDQNVTSPTYSAARTGQSAPHKYLLALSNR